MNIQVRCYATLAKYQPAKADEYPLDQGSTVADLASSLGADQEEIKVAFVNGKHAPMSTQVQDGDRVALFPAVGGG
ncbi:MAG: MoaD/ThiS family protein [Desulfovermiculus sp.]|nr:MoaD/ThiS family protein [Desulfovermiculus sp.]